MKGTVFCAAVLLLGTSMGFGCATDTSSDDNGGLPDRSPTEQADAGSGGGGGGSAGGPGQSGKAGSSAQAGSGGANDVAGSGGDAGAEVGGAAGANDPGAAGAGGSDDPGPAGAGGAADPGGAGGGGSAGEGSGEAGTNGTGTAGSGGTNGKGGSSGSGGSGASGGSGGASGNGGAGTAGNGGAGSSGTGGTSEIPVPTGVPFILLGDVTGATSAEETMIVAGIALANQTMATDCFKNEVLSASWTETNGLSQQQIWDKLCSGPVGVDVDMYTGSWYQNHVTHTIGYEDEPGVVHMNRYYVDTAYMVADNVVHEAEGHSQGFSHYQVKATSVPYGLNQAFEACSPVDP
jgi:hypothetical protein